MTAADRFETARLRAERLGPADLAALYQMHRDPLVMATLGGVRSDEETRKYLRVNMEHWARHGFGVWMLRTLVDGIFVGRCAIRHLEVEGRDELELAWALVPERWGQGYATEAARAMVELARTRLGLGDLVALTLPDNLASRRVMERVGGVHERDVVHAELQHVLYRFRAPLVPGVAG